MSPLRDIRTPLLRLVLALLGVAVIGVLDSFTGYDIGFSVFYLAPVWAAAWWIGRRSALALSGLSALASVLSDSIAGHTYSHLALVVWDLLIKLAFFVIVSELLVRLRASLRREADLARTDPLTGLANRRCFTEMANNEIRRLERYHHAFTLAIIDVDRFKQINDTLGHGVGDSLLMAVASVLQTQLRTTDTAGRLGGDEFAILFPETGEPDARQLLPGLQQRLVNAMKEQSWPVTFSIGAVTFLNTPVNSEEMLVQPDKLMYRVKETGRNGIEYGRY